MRTELTPAEWAKREGIVIVDPDGWRYDRKSIEEPITHAEWERRRDVSTIASRNPNDGNLLDASEPSPEKLMWFERAAVAIEVHKASPGDQWCVWVSNGERGHGWGGSVIAGCATEQDARLVAHALQLARR